MYTLVNKYDFDFDFDDDDDDDDDDDNNNNDDDWCLLIQHQQYHHLVERRYPRQFKLNTHSSKEVGFGLKVMVTGGRGMEIRDAGERDTRVGITCTLFSLYA
jgi:hypothetical protein